MSIDDGKRDGRDLAETSVPTEKIEDSPLGVFNALEERVSELEKQMRELKKHLSQGEIP